MHTKERELSRYKGPFNGEKMLLGVKICGCGNHIVVCVCLLSAVSIACVTSDLRVCLVSTCCVYVANHIPVVISNFMS